jgi:hypothetical protein
METSVLHKTKSLVITHKSAVTFQTDHLTTENTEEHGVFYFSVSLRASVVRCGSSPEIPPCEAHAFRVQSGL